VVRGRTLAQRRCSFCLFSVAYFLLRRLVAGIPFDLRGAFWHSAVTAHTAAACAAADWRYQPASSQPRPLTKKTRRQSAWQRHRYRHKDVRNGAGNMVPRLRGAPASVRASTRRGQAPAISFTKSKTAHIWACVKAFGVRTRAASLTASNPIGSNTTLVVLQQHASSTRTFDFHGLARRRVIFLSAGIATQRIMGQDARPFGHTNKRQRVVLALQSSAPRAATTACGVAAQQHLKPLAQRRFASGGKTYAPFLRAPLSSSALRILLRNAHAGTKRGKTALPGAAAAARASWQHGARACAWAAGGNALAA